MKLLAVSTLEKELLISYKDMIIQQNFFNAYDIPARISVTINQTLNTLQKGTKYKLYFMGIEHEIIMTLNQINKKIVDGVTRNEFVFIHNDFYILANNKVIPDKTNILSIEFKQCLLNGDNHLAYFLNRMRQKSLFLASNEKLEIITKFVNSVFSIPQTQKIITSNRAIIKNLQSKDFYKKNYYTITSNNEIFNTKNGIGEYIYLPFANKNDITGLDIYLLPILQIETTESDLLLGDSVKFDNEVYAVSQIEQIYTLTSKKLLITLSKNIQGLEND